MEIQVTEQEYCKLQIQYEADAEQIEDKRAEVLTAFKKAPVKGYRPGKANIEVIKIYYKKQIEDSLKRALAEAAFHTTLSEKNIKPLGSPDFSDMLLTGNKFTCSFTMNKKPDFELRQYKELEIPKPPNDATVETLTEKYLEEVRTQYGDQVPYTENDFVQKDDKISIQYEGFCDGVKQDNLSSDGDLLTVGANPLKEFDDALLGMTIGETREFDITVPVDGVPSYAGKVIRFVVTLAMGSKINKMPLDDSLALKVGKRDFADLRAYVANIASSRLQESERAELVKQVNARLVAIHDFQVPQWLALSEAKYLAGNAKLNWDTLEDVNREQYLKVASDNVKLALILDRIREEEPDAQLSDQEVIEMIKQNIAKGQSKDQNIDETLLNMNKTGYLPVLISRLRDEYTLDFVIKTVKTIE